MLATMRGGDAPVALSLSTVRGAAGKVNHLTEMLLFLLSLSTMRGADASGSLVRCCLVLSLHCMSPDLTMGCTSTQLVFVIVHLVVFDRSLLLYNY
jgi:hypothetical protein